MKTILAILITIALYIIYSLDRLMYCWTAIDMFGFKKWSKDNYNRGHILDSIKRVSFGMTIVIIYLLIKWL